MKKVGPNENNIGGRGIIENQMLNHQKNLYNMKSTINTGQKNIKGRISSAMSKKKKTEPTYMKEDKFKEVLESFKRVANIKKGTVDSEKPKTFQLKNMLKNKKFKKDEFLDFEHQLNLKSQKRKLIDIENKNKKKNPTEYKKRTDEITLEYEKRLIMSKKRPQSNTLIRNNRGSNNLLCFKIIIIKYFIDLDLNNYDLIQLKIIQ